MANNNQSKKALPKTAGAGATRQKAVATKATAAKSRPAAKSATKGKPASAPATTQPKSISSALNGSNKPVAKPPNAAKPGKPGKAQAKAAPAAQQKEKIKKPKLVRDSFTMPEAEYQVLGEVKKACIKAGFEVKKSELLRVGVALIQTIDLPELRSVLASLPPLKAGRPKKDK